MAGKKDTTARQVAQLEAGGGKRTGLKNVETAEQRNKRLNTPVFVEGLKPLPLAAARKAAPRPTQWNQSTDPTRLSGNEPPARIGVTTAQSAPVSSSTKSSAKSAQETTAMTTKSNKTVATKSAVVASNKSSAASAKGKTVKNNTRPVVKGFTLPEFVTTTTGKRIEQPSVAFVEFLGTAPAERTPAQSAWAGYYLNAKRFAGGKDTAQVNKQSAPSAAPVTQQPEAAPLKAAADAAAKKGRAKNTESAPVATPAAPTNLVALLEASIAANQRVTDALTALLAQTAPAAAPAVSAPEAPAQEAPKAAKPNKKATTTAAPATAAPAQSAQSAPSSDALENLTPEAANGKLKLWVGSNGTRFIAAQKGISGTYNNRYGAAIKTWTDSSTFVDANGVSFTGTKIEASK